MWRNGNPHSPLVGTCSGAAIAENSLAAPQRVKRKSYHMSQLLYSWIQTQEKGKHMSSQKPVYKCP